MPDGSTSYLYLDGSNMILNFRVDTPLKGILVSATSRIIPKTSIFWYWKLWWTATCEGGLLNYDLWPFVHFLQNCCSFLEILDYTRKKNCTLNCTCTYCECSAVDIAAQCGVCRQNLFQRALPSMENQQHESYGGGVGNDCLNLNFRQNFP